jgi:GT2 family glycosyltransferase
MSDFSASDPMNPQLVSIIMVTRNRPVSLEKCLARTRAVLPPEVRILVFDDASTDAEEVRAIIELHPNTLCLRSETCVGPGEGRNRCLRAASTPFCFCMDDDCYLDSIPDLSRWLADRPEDRDIAAVGFRYRNLPAGDLAPASSEPGELGNFLGGANLLRRAAMLRAGGYLGWLLFGVEDVELTMRLRRLGYRVWYDPSVVIQHARSQEGREKRLASFLYVRNTIVINAIYGGRFTGVPLGILRALRRGVFHNEVPSATPAGILAGLRLIWSHRNVRRDLFAPERRPLANSTTRP